MGSTVASGGSTDRRARYIMAQQRRRRGRGPGLALEGLCVALVALVEVTLLFALWRARWDEPFNYDSDASYYLMLVRGLGRSGSYLSNSHLGWPIGQHLAGYPEGGDNLHWLVLAALQQVTGSAPMTVNVFYVGSFATVAVTAHVVLRALGVSRVPAGVVALLYTFVPYHAARNETHLMLASYASVPVAVFLAIRVMDRHDLVLQSGSRRVDWRRRRTWLYFAAAAVLASTGSYYFVFSVLLLGVAGVVTLLTYRSWRPMWTASVLGGASALVYVANLTPSLIERFRHPGAFAAATRPVNDNERWGLRIAQLFLPRDHHRLAPLASLAASSARRSLLPSEGGQQLGTVLAAGLVAALAVLAVRAVAPQSVGRWTGATAQRLGQFGLLAGSCMLAGAIGGLSYVAALAGLRPIRAWNRVSIVVAFCAAGAVAVLLDRVRGAIIERRPDRRRVGGVLVPLVVLSLGLLDQTSLADRPAYAAVHRRYVSDRTFYATVAAHVAPDTPVFELPHISFPERLQLGTGPYDQARGFIFQPGLDWSFGFLRGARPDWAAALDRQPATQWLTTIVAVGFRAVVIDRAGYPDHGTSVEHDLATVVGPSTITSQDGRYAYYSLGDFAVQTERRLGTDTGVQARQAVVQSASA